MRVTVTERARATVQRARSSRAGVLTITIGTGCCESTAPFLYEDFWPGPDQEIVGDVEGVSIFAPEYLRKMYDGDDSLVIDVVENQPAESMSIETEWESRLILRGFGLDLGRDDSCATNAGVGAERDRAPTVSSIATGGPSRVVGEMPEALRRARVR